jgi:hypothetical protein
MGTAQKGDTQSFGGDDEIAPLDESLAALAPLEDELADVDEFDAPLEPVDDDALDEIDCACN